MKRPGVNMISKDGSRAATILTVKDRGFTFFETTTYTKWSKNSEDFNTKASGTFKEAVQHARNWTGRNHENSKKNVKELIQ